MMARRFFLISWIVLIFLPLTNFVSAKGPTQEQAPDGAIYIVQEGDSLWDIAARFRVAMDDLAQANNIADPSQLVVGMRLIIPGLSGVQGVLTTREIGLGEDLRSISRSMQASEDILIRLNHLTSPEELFAGSTLVVPEQNASAGDTIRNLVAPGQSLLELAISQNSNPWTYVRANHLSGTWSGLPGDTLQIADTQTSGAEGNEPTALPGQISAVTLNPTRLVQGKVAEITLQSAEGITLSGRLDGQQLHFFPLPTGGYISLQGIHAMTETGLSRIEITGTLQNGSQFSYAQSVLISNGDYPFDPVLTVSPETIDPSVTKPEDAEWFALTSTATAEKMWDGIFASPAPPPFSDCWPSRFGNRRSYNGSEYSYFHTGLDFCGGVGTEILAPAAGRVVFAGPLTVRGNATLIDHGWGVYSGYAHQSEILVTVGDLVEPGQLIGKVGGTGRVTGPHLHWEILVGGIQVDPMDWLDQIFPN